MGSGLCAASVRCGYSSTCRTEVMATLDPSGCRISENPTSRVSEKGCEQRSKRDFSWYTQAEMDRKFLLASRAPGPQAAGFFGAAWDQTADRDLLLERRSAIGTAISHHKQSRRI